MECEAYPSMAGYSNTPLAKKLGIKSASKLFLMQTPENYLSLVAPLPADVVIAARLTRDTSIMHLFATEQARLA